MWHACPDSTGSNIWQCGPCSSATGVRVWSHKYRNATGDGPDRSTRLNISLIIAGLTRRRRATIFME
ncbi:unnamed protein product [Ascophyllum nodosum]